MNCPKCNYEPTMAEQTNSPNICPSCGVVYAKVKAQQENRSGINYGPSVLDQMSMHAKNAKESVRAGRARRAEAELTSASETVITNIKIPFGSLIWLMTKLILAALPALALAVVILTMLVSVLGGAFSGYKNFSERTSLYSDEPAAKSLDAESDTSLPEIKPKRQEVLNTCKNFESFAEVIMIGRQGGVSMSTAMGDGASELLNHIVVNAYEKPRYRGDEMQRMEVEDFKNDVYLECVNNRS